MIQIEDITKILEKKNPGAVLDVIKAYQIADYAHSGVMRESGEPYITHPLHVAKNILDMEIYDKDTLCAAILHDVVEDSHVTLEDIEHELGQTVAELVDGVTKMRRLNFSSKQEQNNANTRKIVISLRKDMRVIIIKLADRLHNMETLQFKTPKKQLENAEETMDLFVPLSLSIGAYQVKSKLEDLSLQYIDPYFYQEIFEKREELAIKEKAYLAELKGKIDAILSQKNVPHDILIRTRNICTIYRKIQKGYAMEDINDIFYLKVLVDEIDRCFTTLRIVHRLVPPINGKFKDYIHKPRTNYYQSLHTTGTDANGKIIKTKIRTFDMDKVSAFGLPAYWNITPGEKEENAPRRMTIEETQQELLKNMPLAKQLKEMEDYLPDDYEFIQALKETLMTEHIYVNAGNGRTVELPVGSTALDFACQEFPELLDTMTGVIINEKRCPINTVLENNDTVVIDTKGKANHEDWANAVHTFTGKLKIKLLLNGQIS